VHGSKSRAITIPEVPSSSATAASPSDHPNRPGRGVLVLAFVGIVVAGCLGGAIGWGVVASSCTEKPPVGDQLLEAVPGVEVNTHSCDAALVGAAVVGAAVAAIGAGVVAGLMLRAQSEWRAHPPPAGAHRGARPQPQRVNRSGSGGSPPHT
jgi:F0F1-type ATP synthase membrane subunit c/vacuolar-type H+-ATPase subunit K